MALAPDSFSQLPNSSSFPLKNSINYNNKGARPEAVRGGQLSSDGEAVLATPPGNSLSEAMDFQKQAWMHADSVSTSSGEKQHGQAICSSDIAKPSKPAWKKPLSSQGEAPTSGTVMGAISWPPLADSRPSKPPSPDSKSISSMPPIQGLQKQEPAAAPRNPGDGHRSSGAEDRYKFGNGMFGPSTQISHPSPLSIDAAIPTVMQHPGSLPLDYHLRGSGGAGNPEHPRPYYNRDSYPVNYTNRRNNMKEQGRGNYGWRSHNRGFMGGRGIGMPFQQQRVGPRNLPRHVPPFMGTNPGFINAAALQNAAGGMYYISVPPPVPADLIQGPAFFVPPGPPVPIPVVDPISMRDALAKQIEYYFSVENLCRDVYLRSNMDEQGFVPASIIANFNRVRRWTSNIELILDSLCNSSVVEVQGDKMRPRHDWVKWPLPSSHRDTAASVPVSQRESCKALTQMDQRSLEVEHRKTDSDRLDQTSSGMFVNNLDSKQQLATETFSKYNTGTAMDSLHAECSAFEIGLLEGNSKDSNSPFSSSLELGSSKGEVNIEQSSSSKNPGFMSTGDRTSELRTAEEKLDGPSAATAMRKFMSFNKEYAFQLEEEVRSELRSLCEEGEDDSEVTDKEVEQLIIVIQGKKASKGDNKVPECKDIGWKAIPDDPVAVTTDGISFYDQKSSENETKDLSPNKQSLVDMKGGSNSADSRRVASTDGGSSLGGSEVYSHSHQRMRSNRSRDIYSETFLQIEGVKLQGRDNTTIENPREIPPSDIVGFLFSSSSPDSQSGLKVGSSTLKLDSSHGNGPFTGCSPPMGSMLKSFMKSQYPSYSVLEDSACKQQKYIKFHKHCIAERKRLGIGCSEDMNDLFRFWSYFLQEHYNKTLYKEFHKLAEEDAAAKYNFGLECLFRFYSCGLEKKFRQNLYEDFEKLALKAYQKGCLCGLEEYWAFHFYRKKTDDPPLKKHPELERLLAEEFRTRADFERARERVEKDISSGVAISSNEVAFDMLTEVTEPSSLAGHTPGTPVDSMASITSIIVS